MYQYHILPNGIRIIFKANHSAVVHSGVYINIGSRDERQASQEGMAHFIEHCIFKGTEHRRSYHILNRIDGVGGELNAFTTKEETCVYASSLNEHLPRCLELFADILFHSTFPEREIAKERDVVIEEINSYKDAPSELIFDDFEEMAFQGHPLAHNILGSKRNVRSFTSERIKTFMNENYTTERIVIAVVGGIDFKRVVYYCEKYFRDIAARSSHADRSTRPTFQPFNKSLSRHTHQTHLLIGGEAYNSFDERRTTFALLNNILGGPAMNSKLNVTIREKHGFCYTVESQYTPFSDTGLFYIYAGIDGEACERFFDLLWHELKVLRDTPLSTLQLHTAQQQYIGQMAISSELGLNEMQAIGKSYLVFDRVDDLEEMSADVRSVTSRQIQEVANDILREDKFGILIYR